MIDRHLRKMQAHELCRTNARGLYEAGLDIEAIRQNLGHADRKTTQGYYRRGIIFYAVFRVGRMSRMHLHKPSKRLYDDRLPNQDATYDLPEFGVRCRR